MLLYFFSEVRCAPVLGILNSLCVMHLIDSILCDTSSVVGVSRFLIKTDFVMNYKLFVSQNVDLHAVFFAWQCVLEITCRWLLAVTMIFV